MKRVSQKVRLLLLIGERTVGLLMKYLLPAGRPAMKVDGNDLKIVYN